MSRATPAMADPIFNTQSVEERKRAQQNGELFDNRRLQAVMNPRWASAALVRSSLSRQCDLLFHVYRSRNVAFEPKLLLNFPRAKPQMPHSDAANKETLGNPPRMIRVVMAVEDGSHLDTWPRWSCPFLDQDKEQCSVRKCSTERVLVSVGGFIFFVVTWSTAGSRTRLRTSFSAVFMSLSPFVAHPWPKNIGLMRPVPLRRCLDRTVKRFGLSSSSNIQGLTTMRSRAEPRSDKEGRAPQCTATTFMNLPTRGHAPQFPSWRPAQTQLKHAGHRAQTSTACMQRLQTASRPTLISQRELSELPAIHTSRHCCANAVPPFLVRCSREPAQHDSATTTTASRTSASKNRNRRWTSGCGSPPLPHLPLHGGGRAVSAHPRPPSRVVAAACVAPATFPQSPTTPPLRSPPPMPPSS